MDLVYAEATTDDWNLWRIFTLIVRKNEPQIPLEQLPDIIKRDLGLEIDTLNETQAKTLPYMLVSYAKKWPGWEKRTDFHGGRLKLEDWYKKFHHYIKYKMTVVITKLIPEVSAELEKEKKIKKKTCTMGTQLSNRPTMASFSLDIAGPASLLSTLVFSGCGNDIIMEECVANMWTPLSLVELLNYPFVEVEFNSPELSFKRKMDPKYNRFISLSSELTEEKPNFIISKSHKRTGSTKFVFQVSVLQKYVEIYKEIVIPQIKEDERDEIVAILDQFLQDIMDINQNNMVAVDRTVTFNIGRNIYLRSKAMQTSDSNRAHNRPTPIYNEVLIPRLTSSFRYFTGMQKCDDKGNRTVVTEQDCDTKIMLNFFPQINYKCTFCKLQLPNSKSMEEHLKEKHKSEPPLLCFACKHSFPVTVLALQRWKCSCQN